MKIKNVFYIGALFSLQESFAPPKNQEAKAEFKGIMAYNNGKDTCPDTDTIVRYDESVTPEVMTLVVRNGVYCTPTLHPITEELTFPPVTEQQIRATNKAWQSLYKGKYFLIQEGDKHVCLI